MIQNNKVVFRQTVQSREVCLRRLKGSGGLRIRRRQACNHRGKSDSESRNSMCKDPEVGKSFMCSRDLNASQCRWSNRQRREEYKRRLQRRQKPDQF